MKPFTDRLVIVTASADQDRAQDCLDSWEDKAFYRCTRLIFANGTKYDKDYYPPVPAFALAVADALELCPKAEVICCFHDDLLIEQRSWDLDVLDHFDAHPECGLAGFGGGVGLGDEDLYQKPYDPNQLARKDFVSNMRDAEAHGRRMVSPKRVSCLDGFSQIGRRAFWEGEGFAATVRKCPTCGASGFHPGPVRGTCAFCNGQFNSEPQPNLFQLLANLGVRHHMYDGALGCFAKRLGWTTWMLPIRVHHFGGRTAVGDEGYHAWTKTQHHEGDQGFWKEAHGIVYEEFRDVLPLRI